MFLPTSQEVGLSFENFEYNSRNQVTRHTDVREAQNVYSYDANGMPATKKVGDRSAIPTVLRNTILKTWDFFIQADRLGISSRVSVYLSFAMMIYNAPHW